MSSFRKAKSEALLRLYNLPRRELQALCKQYGISTNKSTVAMADALSACVPVDTAKSKAWAGASSLKVSKTTPLKMKIDGATGFPETSLVTFTSSGKRNLSPVKIAEKPTIPDREEVSFLKPNTTPLRRGVKRSERPLIQTQHEEKSKATFNPVYSRAAFLMDRFGKAAAATSSHRPPAPTPGKRPGKVEDTVTVSGADSIPPVSHTEIEFRNAALHKELFGIRRDVSELQKDQDVTPVAEYRGDVPESSVVGFEFRDMALHKELFGSNLKLNATNPQEYGSSTSHDLQSPEARSACATIHLISSEHGVFNSPLTSSPEVLDYSGLDIRVLSSIREENASDDSGSKVETLQEHIQRHQRPQGRDLGPSLDDMSRGYPACSLSRMEEKIDLAFEQASESAVLSPERCMPLTTNIQNSPLVKEATPLTKIRNSIGCTLTKATSILEKLAALRADAEKKRREGFWEPKFSAVVEDASPVAVFQTALVVDRDLPSAKKARLTPKALSSSEKGFIVCEDADIVSKGEIPSATRTIPIPNASRDFVLVVSDKENQSETKSMENWNSGKLGGLGKERKSKQIEALRDRSKNLSDHVNNEINEPGSIKPGFGEVRPEELSLRKLRAQFKEKIRHLEAAKASDLRPWSERVAWNTSR
ncbi:hypothetical protein M758_12G094400 [Ceratodon purpureus]|nr:hypothetical protein M758_12G094400 [Ceratodon purpureus]